MADQAQAFAAHVLPLAVTDDVRVPVRKAVDAAPGDLLLHSHETGHIIGHCDAFAPVAKIESRNEIDLDGAPEGVRAGGLAVIMIG
jgi:hypothetical protein